MSAGARLRVLFFTGLVVVVHVWGTVLILATLFRTLDGALASLLGSQMGFAVPGLGVATLIVIIFVTGAIASNLIGGNVVKASEAGLLRIPLVRSIYATFKSVTDIFAFLDRQRENRVVLLPFPRLGIYAVGLVIGEAPEVLQRSPIGRLRLVFIPTAPHPFTGYLALVLENELTPLSLGFHDAMKMQFSCGLYLPGSHASH